MMPSELMHSAVDAFSNDAFSSDAFSTDVSSRVVEPDSAHAGRKDINALDERA